MLSIVIPVCRNEKNIDRLVPELERIAALALPGYLIDRAESFQLDRMIRSTGAASRR
jgi:hypothetical protein